MFIIEDFDELMHDYVSPEFREWLIINGFFTAPASTKYHGSYEGGLFDHCYNVANVLVEISKRENLSWQNERSPLIIGMFHDLCKIDNYIPTDDGYKYNANTLLQGHGDKSVMILAQHLQLTEEEIICIRYHMGAYADKEEWAFYDRAIRKYPNVLATHTADMIASKLIEK
ncbi:MAG: hypothetical protein PUE56_04525 [Clostridium sp.]|nr:hypothetical protein [Clostridium sp.]